MEDGLRVTGMALASMPRFPGHGERASWLGKYSTRLAGDGAVVDSKVPKWPGGTCAAPARAGFWPTYASAARPKGLWA